MTVDPFNPSTASPEPAGETLLVAPRARRFRGGALAVLVALAAFFVTRTLVEFAFDMAVVFKAFGLHSPTDDFDFLPFVLLSSLSLGFNATICCALGLISHRLVEKFRHPVDRFASAAVRYAGFPALVLAAWLALLNLPRFLPSRDPEQWLTLDWPPEWFYPPVRLLLLAFYPLGNLGAVTGFTVGMLLAEIRSRKRDKRAAGPRAAG